MNCKDIFKKYIKKYSEQNIVISAHAQFRASKRGMDLEEIKSNLLNPKRLAFANRVDSEEDGLEKFKCYFAYSKTQCHIYVIKINRNAIVKTVIKINKRWQKRAEKNVKI